MSGSGPLIFHRRTKAKHLGCFQHLWTHPSHWIEFASHCWLEQAIQLKLYGANRAMRVRVSIGLNPFGSIVAKESWPVEGRCGLQCSARYTYRLTVPQRFGEASNFCRCLSLPRISLSYYSGEDSTPNSGKPAGNSLALPLFPSIVAIS